MGKTLPKNYETLNLNDFPNTFVFLWTIFVNNNWVTLSYMALLKYNNPYIKYFFMIFY